MFDYIERPDDADLRVGESEIASTRRADSANVGAVLAQNSLGVEAP
jgi:hypothetical protein